MKTSLIITTYNWPSALSLVLQSIEKQSVIPDEVIIADDGSGEETRSLIEKIKQRSSLNITHVWQEDDGFRASEIRNKGIKASTGDYIILIDGDMVLHPDFIKDHSSFAKKGFFTQGSRMLSTEKLGNKMIGEQSYRFSFFEEGLKNKKHLLRSKLLRQLSAGRGQKSLKGIRTCNMGFFREDLIAINGFNESFKGWGREDTELVVRLMNNGIERQNLKFSALAIHLYHFERERDRLSDNDSILEETIKNNKTYISNGIQK